jgi:hypothetical protein
MRAPDRIEAGTPIKIVRKGRHPEPPSVRP